MTRPKLAPQTETEVLAASRRRCAICFGLEGDLSRKKGQIAHLDRNPANNAIDNLAFLCFDHHDEYDSSTSQSKGLQLREVKVYRQGLYEAVRQYLTHDTPNDTSSDTEPGSALLSKGEFAFYQGQYEAHLSESLRLLKSISDLLGRYNSQTEERTIRLNDLVAAPSFNLRLHKELDQLGGSQMAAFANDLVATSSPLVVITDKMLDALTRSSAVASDFEGVDRSIFEQRLAEVQGIRGMFATTIEKASVCRGQIARYPRGSTTFNRGRRLALAGIEEHIGQISRIRESLAAAESDLMKVIALL